MFDVDVAICSTVPPNYCIIILVFSQRNVIELNDGQLESWPLNVTGGRAFRRSLCVCKCVNS